MKAIKIICLVALVAMAFSCKKEDPAPAHFMNVAINGTEEQSIAITAVLQDKGYGIIAVLPNNRSVTISTGSEPLIGDPIPYLTKTGTYKFGGYGDIGGNEVIFIGAHLNENQTSLISTSGTITITELSETTIAGNFSFDCEALITGTEKTSLTAGNFSAPITKN